jgi:hypothetical protein
MSKSLPAGRQANANPPAGGSNQILTSNFKEILRQAQDDRIAGVYFQEI